MRGELARGLEGVPAEDAVRRLERMNCISWIVGRLAAQERYLWVEAGQGRFLAPGLYQRVGYGQPASTPPLDEMWEVWQTVTAAAEEFLDRLTVEELQGHVELGCRALKESVGTLLMRNFYHYWFHTGEAHAIRQMLGHGELPQYGGYVEGGVPAADPAGSAGRFPVGGGLVGRLLYQVLAGAIGGRAWSMWK